MSDLTRLIDALVRQGLSSDEYGNNVHPVAKLLSSLVPLVLCAFFLAIRVWGRGKIDDTALWLCFLLVLFGQRIDLRRKYVWRFLIHVLIVGLIIAYTLLFPSDLVRHSGLSSIINGGLIRFLSVIGSYISTEDIILLAFAVLSVRGIVRLYFVDAIWIGNSVFRGRLRIGYYVIVVTYFVCRVFVGRAISNSWRAANSRRIMIRRKVGWLKSWANHIEIFVSRVLDELSRIADLAEATLRERGLLEVREEYAVKIAASWVVEDYISSLFLLATMCFGIYSQLT